MTQLKKIKTKPPERMYETVILPRRGYSLKVGCKGKKLDWLWSFVDGYGNEILFRGYKGKTQYCLGDKWKIL